MGHVVHAVFEDLNLIGFLNQRVELNTNLTLTSGADFVVVYFNRQAHLLHGGTHGCADVV